MKQTKDSSGQTTRFFLFPRGIDPNAPSNREKGIPCTSVRRQRAIRQSRYMHGTKLYELSAERNGFVEVK